MSDQNDAPAIKEYLVLEPDVYEFFKKLGGDMAAEVNRILREYIQRHRETERVQSQSEL